MSAAPEPVADAVLEDLRERLRATRRPVLPVVRGWERGTDAAYLAELVSEWARYDWRTHEARIRALPWRRAEDLRVVHQRADGPTVVLLHGWPDSVLRFERALPLLADVDVVIPALPGYPFSEPATGMSTTAMADAVAAGLAALGIERYVVSGGDIGSSVAAGLAHRHADHVAALHLTDVPVAIGDIDPADLSDAEREYAEAVRHWRHAEGGYMHEHSTKPHTLAAGLADSPAGLLAWIVEKLRAWSDGFDASFSREEVLTWASAYWVTNTIGTSFSPYFEPREPYADIAVPTAVTLFPADIATAPRELAERVFDVRHYEILPDGGHFAAWERPEAYVSGLRAALALT